MSRELPACQAQGRSHGKRMREKREAAGFTLRKQLEWQTILHPGKRQTQQHTILQRAWMGAPVGGTEMGQGQNSSAQEEQGRTLSLMLGR